MHRPPAVSYSVVRSRWHGRTLAGFWILSAALVQLALWRYSYTPAALLALEGACLVTGLWAVWSWRAAPVGRLRWDGEHWHWEGFADEPACQLTVHFDFQTVVLASLQGPARRFVWLWLESATVSRTQWLALRRALVASRQPAQPQPPAVPHEQLP